MKYTLETTNEYDRWFGSIKDRTTRIRVLARLSRVENGNFGDCKQISEGLHELRFFLGGGVRIYYTIRNKVVVFLLTGGRQIFTEEKHCSGHQAFKRAGGLNYGNDKTV